MEFSLYRASKRQSQGIFHQAQCSVEGKLLKTKELLYLLERDLSAPQNEGMMAACVGTPGLELT